MYMHQVLQPRSSPDEYGHNNIESHTATWFDSKGEPLQSDSRDRLVYFTTCLIGHQVEVQVLDGSVFSGIFHATNAEDFGIVLKMAQTIKDASQGQKNISDYTTKPLSWTLIIPAKDLVQVIAKGVQVTSNGSTNELQHEKQQELMTDSCISQSGHVELGRELERWVPDENDPGCPELEDIFDGSWNRGWDQFEVNNTLFGVTSTFDEDLYTTKLEKGPQMRELEREALRIAREIEGEKTHDLHIAEERGIQLDGTVELDEETRFSSVYRVIDDSGYDEIEDILLNSQNGETFGGVYDSVIGKTRTDMSCQKTSDETQVSTRSSLMGETQSSITATSRDLHLSGFEDDGKHLPKHSSGIDAIRVHHDTLIGKERQKSHDKSQVSNAYGSHPLLRSMKEISDKVGLSPNATAFDPSYAASRGQGTTYSSNELLEGTHPSRTQGTASSLARPSSSPASDGRVLSPSSSIGSLSSEKSTLNPHAKEFKFNVNAKSFIPSQAPVRPSSPVADTPFYFPASMNAATHMHGMPVGFENGHSFAAQQPVLFSSQAAPMAQPYYHPNGPQYAQQMMIGQPHPGLYMPTYPPEMQYK